MESSTCQNPECQFEFEISYAQQKYCSVVCRLRASRLRHAKRAAKLRMDYYWRKKAGDGTRYYKTKKDPSQSESPLMRQMHKKVDSISN